jgi:hypothetical protein
MQRTVTVKSGDNCLVLALAGARSYVKILEAESDLVILQSVSSGITEIQHVVKPGRYRIETDGRLTAARSIYLDLKANMGTRR